MFLFRILSFSKIHKNALNFIAKNNSSGPSIDKIKQLNGIKSIKVESYVSVAKLWVHRNQVITVVSKRAFLAQFCGASIVFLRNSFCDEFCVKLSSFCQWKNFKKLDRHEATIPISAKLKFLKNIFGFNFCRITKFRKTILRLVYYYKRKIFHSICFWKVSDITKQTHDTVVLYQTFCALLCGSIFR